MGRLERHLDIGLIRRALSGIKPKPEPLKKVKPHRDASTYRGARHNAVKRARRLAA